MLSGVQRGYRGRTVLAARRQPGHRRGLKLQRSPCLHGNNRIQKFDSTRNVFFTKWGSPGTGDGQFSGATGIALDSSGNLYVADTNNSRIQKFDNTGTFLTKWGSYGSGNGQFYSATGIAVDGSGNIFVADPNGQRIQKFACP